MSPEFVHSPMLDRFYQQFLKSENSADFVDRVTKHYCAGTLEKLSQFGPRTTRRAAVLALGFIGDYSQNEALGSALIDSDRAVRLLADHGLRQIWFRQGSQFEQQFAKKLARSNNRNLHAEVVELSDWMITRSDSLAEVWNQRALALYALSDYELAIASCQEALYLNRYHFLAGIGLANCHLQTDDVTAALEAFRLSLRINPDLENVRGQILHLEKIVED